MGNCSCTDMTSDTPAADRPHGTADVCPDARVIRFQQRCEKFTDILYRCLVKKTPCQHRLTLSSRSYCIWLLKNEAARADMELPCYEESAV